MLKKRSRPLSGGGGGGGGGNQALITDPFVLPSPTSNYNKPPASPLFPLSPRLLVGFSPKLGFLDHEAAAMSPTSILETTKPFANPFLAADKAVRRPFIEPPQEPKPYHPIGLGIVDELKEPEKPESRMVLFGSQLKVQIPLPNRSPIEFRSNCDSEQSPLLSGCISASEMEISEDYTCVIAHGPNPRTVHIYDNCIMESCGDGYVAVSPRPESRVADGFLTRCHACKKKLAQGKDIFMYRGEKAFCSRECRHQEILVDEGMEDSSSAPSTAL